MKLFTIALLTLVSSVTFANTFRAATVQEKLNLCQAVDDLLIEENADMAVNTDSCPKAFIRVKGDVIEGNVPFLAPSRHFDMKCKAKLVGRKVAIRTIVCK